MTGQSQTRSGGLSATRAFGDSSSSAADLSNVIPFARARRVGAEPYSPPVIVNPADRPAPLPSGRKRWLQALLVMGSLVVHGGMLYALWQEPEPLSGSGIQAITVEVMVGDNRPVGAAATPGADLIDQQQVDERKPNEKPADEDRVTEARDVKPDQARTEVTTEQEAEQTEQQDPDKRQAIAMVETPQDEIPTALPRETPPDMQAVIAPPRELPKEAHPEPQAKKADEPSPETRAANGSGFSSAASVAAYNASLTEYLTKHQRDPRPARSSRRIQGRGTVWFSIDADGDVTSVSVTKSTGMRILDEEMIAMVRRASPFPAPPDGQPKKFNAPVSFDLN
jgi:periplasmic protein TonB